MTRLSRSVINVKSHFTARALHSKSTPQLIASGIRSVTRKSFYSFTLYNTVQYCTVLHARPCKTTLYYSSSSITPVICAPDTSRASENRSGKETGSVLFVIYIGSSTMTFEAPIDKSLRAVILSGGGGRLLAGSHRMLG